METTANVLAELRRESQSIFNRIHSIAEDAAFVQQVHNHYPDLPLLRTFISPLRGYPAETRAAANMRCGAWYTDPSIVSNRSPYCTLTLTLTGRAYFKSTDGHTNNWSFNLRRPNLHVLPLIAKHAG